MKTTINLVSILMLITLVACGSAAEPTLDVLDIQDTAVALAQTSVAITKLAMPADTPIPPTPFPTLAAPPTPLPTLPPAVTPTSIVVTPENTQVNPCNEPPPAAPKGTTVQVRFVNKSKGLVNLSFGMLQENDEEECGTYSFTIGANTAPEVEVLAGCYWAYAWITNTGGEPSIARSTSDICVTDPNQVRGVTITPETVGFD